MSGNAKGIIDIAEALLFESEEEKPVEIANDLLLYMFSDEVLNAVIQNISFPKDIDIKMQIERKKSTRFSETHRNRLEGRSNIIKEIRRFNGNRSPLVWNGADQISFAPFQQLYFSSTKSEYMLPKVVESETTTGFIGYGGRHSIENSSANLTSRWFIRDIRETLFTTGERLDKGSLIDIVTARKILNVFDKFTSIPYYESRLFGLLERDKALRQDTLSSKFIDLLPKEEKLYQSSGQKTVSKKVKRMKRLLYEIIISESSRTIMKLQDKYINDEITYEQYLGEMTEISNYAFEKWG